MKLFCLLFLISARAFALEAVVTVLETPLLDKPDLDANVVQYYRKGDVLKVHPSLNNTKKFEYLAPKKRAKIDFSDDPLLKDVKPVQASLKDDFIPVVDRRGRTAYIQTTHIYVYFENKKEFDQVIEPNDETDYRLKEPLPKNYPFKTKGGYRGYLTVGFAQPYTESYPYLTSTKRKGYSNPIDVNATFLKQFSFDHQDRFFWGVTLNIRSFENTYSLQNLTFASEKGLRLALGPTLSFDAYKGVKNRVNLTGTLLLNAFNQIRISQETTSGSDVRNYRTTNVTPLLNVQYHRKSIMENIDFLIGTSMAVEPPATFKAKNGASVANIWKHEGNDQFTTRIVFTLTGYLGFQYAY
jgi:hypothetical protein